MLDIRKITKKQTWYKNTLLKTIPMVGNGRFCIHEVYIYLFYLTSVETSNNFQNIWSLRRKGKAKGSCCFQVKKNVRINEYQI